MFDTLTRMTSRIAPSTKQLATVAVLLLFADLTITVALDGLAYEAHPLSAYLSDTVGWNLTALIGVSTVGGWYGYLVYRGDRHARIAAISGIPVLAVPVVWNVGVYARLGAPSLDWVWTAEAIAPSVAVVLGVIALREIATKHPPTSVGAKEAKAVALAVIMLTSIPAGLALAGGQPVPAKTPENTEKIDGGGVQVNPAVEVKTMSKNWEHSKHGAAPDTVTMDGDGVVYSANDDEIMSYKDGSVLWNVSNPHAIRYKMEYHEARDQLFLGLTTDTPGISQYDASDGSQTNTYNMYRHHADGMALGYKDHVFGFNWDDTQKIEINVGSTHIGSHGTSRYGADEYDGYVYIGSANNELLNASASEMANDDGSDGTTTYGTVVHTEHNQSVKDVVAGNGYVVSQSWEDLVIHNVSNGSQTVAYNNSSTAIRSIAMNNKTAFVGFDSGSVYGFDLETGQKVSEHSLHSDRVTGLTANSDDVISSSLDGRVISADIPAANPVSVQVTDQDGNPINDSTVQATVVDQDALDSSTLDQTAQELLDDAENPEPPSYDARMNLDSEFDDIDAEFVSVHPESQMSTIEASTGGLDPDVQVASGEEIYLMSWDATDDPGFLSTDLINRQLPGSPTSSTIVIEQLDHSGDVTETRELKTEGPQATASIGYLDILDDYSKTHVSTRLPDGFYRVSTKDSDFAYVIAVGNPAQIIEQELKDEADRLTDHALKMRDRHNNGIFQTVTASTNETGETTLDIPDSASVIQVQAYKGPSPSTVGASTTADITMQDIRDSREAGYDEAIYLSTEPERVDMSQTDGSVTVKMHKLDGSPMEDMSDWDQRVEDALNEALNASISELESVYDDRLETIEREELERRHDDLRNIVDRAGLMDRVEELLGREVTDSATGSDAELQEDLGAMEQALGEQQSQGSNGEETSSIDSGELYTEIPFASEIDEDAITVIVHTEAGESITLPDSEYQIESNGIIDGGDTVVIDGYELSTNTAVADVEVRGVSPAGRTLRERVSAVNPKMSGNVPGIDAVDVNTMRPGPDERVGLQLRPNDADAYDSLSSVNVYGPDGQTVPVTLDGERAHFDTEGEGVYSIRTTYAGSDGTEFVETIRLRAGSRMISERPTVRITEGLGGPTAIVGQGLDSATIETVDGETVITARQPGDATSAPGEIHIEAQQLDASNTITVNVVRGELEESVNAHTNVVLHTTEIGNDALVYRNGKPVTADGDTRFGEYETRENADGVTKTVIYTYSDSDGTVQMSISEDPGVVERVLFDLRVRSPVDVPLAGMLYGAVELSDSVPLGPTAALQTVDTPELREADPGKIITSSSVVNSPGVAS